MSRRLQVQENLTAQIAHAVAAAIQPKGVGVVMEAQHLCMLMRGVQKQRPGDHEAACWAVSSRTHAHGFLQPSTAGSHTRG